MALLEMAQNRGTSECFMPDDCPQYGLAQKAMAKSRNKQLVELFNGGLGCHHAGMLRTDRTLVEKLFSQGTVYIFRE
jgi:replicative superfamily II helicase